MTTKDSLKNEFTYNGFKVRLFHVAGEETFVTLVCNGTRLQSIDCENLVDGERIFRLMSDTVRDIVMCMTEKSNVVESTEITSEPDAHIEVKRIHLTDNARKSLNLPPK